MSEKYTICSITICAGYTVLINHKTAEFETEAEAQAELASDPEFYEDCFVCKFSEIKHKTIYQGENHAKSY